MISRRREKFGKLEKENNNLNRDSPQLSYYSTGETTISKIFRRKSVAFRRKEYNYTSSLEIERQTTRKKKGRKEEKISKGK